VLAETVYRAHTDFDLLTFFEPYVRQWLVSIDSKTTQWVQAVSQTTLRYAMQPDLTPFTGYRSGQGDLQSILGSSLDPDHILKFEPEGEDKNSSSIVDLFDSMRSPINFLKDLEWLDEYQEARFFTSLSKVSSSKPSSLTSD
jgi:hypothetical protein